VRPRELATIAVAAIFLPFIGPGVPRGAFLMLAPLFLAIGLPAEGIGILTAVDALPDVFSTVLNVAGDLAAAEIIQRGESPTSSRIELPNARCAARLESHQTGWPRPRVWPECRRRAAPRWPRRSRCRVA
jgi:Na+/H+-dicarboxylate symporter